MFRTIHFFGCSFTYGAGLKNRHRQAYPFHLAKKYNAPFKNYGIPGGSDYYSLSILFRLQTRGYIVEDDLIVFQWSQAHRHPIPLASADAEFEADASPRFNTTAHLLNYPFVEMHNLNKLSREHKYFIKNYVNYINPDAHYKFNNLVLKELLDGWAISRNINLIQFISHPFHDHIPTFESFTPETMQQFLDNHGFKSDLPCGHPSADGHKRWAEHLYYLHDHRFRSPLI